MIIVQLKQLLLHDRFIYWLRNVNVCSNTETLHSTLEIIKCRTHSNFQILNFFVLDLLSDYFYCLKPIHYGHIYIHKNKIKRLISFIELDDFIYCLLTVKCLFYDKIRVLPQHHSQDGDVYVCIIYN